MSLKKPRMRLKNVPIPMVVAAFAILWFSDIGDRKTIPDYTDFQKMIAQICVAGSAEFYSLESYFVIGVIRDSLLWNVENALTHAIPEC
jgi:hypothetical protein